MRGARHTALMADGVRTGNQYSESNFNRLSQETRNVETER